MLTAAAASSSPAAAAKARCAHASASPARISTAAAGEALHCLIDRMRQRQGLGPLRDEAHLRRAAAGHAADMAANDYFDHRSPDGSTPAARVRRTGYLRGARRWWLGEAIVWGRRRTGTASSMLHRLMASPVHRALLLNATFRDLGIGLARGAPQGHGSAALTVTLDFGARRRR